MFTSLKPPPFHCLRRKTATQTTLKFLCISQFSLSSVFVQPPQHHHPPSTTSCASPTATPTQPVCPSPSPASPLPRPHLSLSLSLSLSLVFFSLSPRAPTNPSPASPEFRAFRRCYRSPTHCQPSFFALSLVTRISRGNGITFASFYFMYLSPSIYHGRLFLLWA